MNAPRTLLPWLACAVLAGCGEEVSTVADAQGALGPQLDFETALLRAAALGEALVVPIEALQSSYDPLELEVERSFGARAEGVEVDGWLEVDAAFRFRPGLCDSLATAESPSGRRALVLASPDASLFYEWTVIETDTGRLYQSVGQVSAGCDTGKVSWFGPFVPGPEATLTGDFSDEQRESLAFAISDALRNALEPAR